MRFEQIDELTDITPFEKAKLRNDYEQIKIERFKAWATVLSIVIPILIASITIIYGVWSQNERAKSDFEIKAVEIILNSSSLKAATNKAIVLSELFPNRLPRDFKDKLIDSNKNT